MADHEIAEEDHAPPRVTSYVRDLDDVLQDKPYPTAIQDCTQKHRDHFTPARWASFKSDIRELHRLVPDTWWNEVVFDAGFNPPPSWVVLGSAIANVIPIRAAGIPTYLAATSIDMMLLLACYFAIRTSFGRVSAVLAVIFFGASFIASYAWNGGAFLRFSWITAVVLSLAAMRRGRWALAGALLGAAVCDRIFPAGFAIGAAVPLAYRALLLRSPDARKVLMRFGAGFGGTIAVLVALSCVVFGLPSWVTFFSRILRHGDVYYVMHIGLKKVLTFRDWVPSQNFQGHDGLRRFHDWNLHLRATWAAMRPLVIPIQLLAVVGAGCASLRRRPYEAALLCGVVFMFVFNLPANYYYVVLTLVPALLFHSAATRANRRGSPGARVHRPRGVQHLLGPYAGRAARLWRRHRLRLLDLRRARGLPRGLDRRVDRARLAPGAADDPPPGGLSGRCNVWCGARAPSRRWRAGGRRALALDDVHPASPPLAVSLYLVSMSASGVSRIVAITLSSDTLLASVLPTSRSATR